MGKKKIVIDTNNLISALGWNGKSRILLEKVKNCEFEWIISTKQLDELKRVLNYPRLHIPVAQQEQFLKIVFQIAKIITTKSVITIIEDPADNMLLECAVDGRAEYIISGDKEVLRVKEYRGIKIMTVDKFLKEA